MPKIHRPDIYGDVRLAGAPGIIGQVLTSAGLNAQAVWSTPSGGGGLIHITGCPTLSGLTPGSVYWISGLTQGTLGTFDVIAIAYSATQLSGEVDVYPATNPGDGWTGIIDWSDCQLTRLLDPLFNDISGKTNIGVFPWFNTLANNNKVDSVSTLTFSAGWPLAGDTFNNNTLKRAVFTIDDLGDDLTVTGNTIEDGNFSISSNGNGIEVFTRDNYVVDGFVTIATLDDQVQFDDNTVQNSSNVNVTATYELTVRTNVVQNASTLDITGSGAGVLTLSDNSFTDQSDINITPDSLARNMNIQYILTNHGVINILGAHGTGSTESYQFGEINNSGLLNVGGLSNGINSTINYFSILNNSTIEVNGAGGILINVVAEDTGTLTANGFTGQRIRLASANLILTTGLSDFIRGGYRGHYKLKPTTFIDGDTLQSDDNHVMIYASAGVANADLANPTWTNQVYITNQSTDASTISIDTLALINGAGSLSLAFGAHAHLFWTGSTWYTI